MEGSRGMKNKSQKEERNGKIAGLQRGEEKQE